MNKYKSVFVIFIIVFIIIVQPVYAVTENAIIQQSNSNVFWDGFFDLLNILIIAGNFAFVVWIYFKDKREKKEYDKNSYKMYWYKKFILENYLTLIEKFFNECETSIKMINDDKKSNMTLEDIAEYKKDKFMEFTKNQSIIKQKLTNILSILDEGISNNIRNIFIKLQEEFTELLDKMIMSDESNSTQRLQECNEVLQERKREILKELYTYGENIIR